MNNRIFRQSLVLISALLLLVLCACGERQEKNVTEEASEVVVRFFGILGESEDAEITQNVLTRFTAENSNVTLYYSGVTAEDAYKLSLPDSATYRHNSPDIVYAPLYAVQDVLSEEYASIDEIRSYMPYYCSETQDYALLCNPSGKAYGVAVRGKGSVLVVNTDLASNTDNLLETVRELSDTDIYLFADNALDSELFFEYIMTVYTNSEISPDNPQSYWVDGFELFSQLVKQGAFAPSDKDPTTLFMENKAVFAVLSEENAAALEGENYKCAAYFGGFTEGFFITSSAISSPLKRQTVLTLATELLKQQSSYATDSIRADGTGVFFTLDSAYWLTPCSDTFGKGCWDEVLTELTRGDSPQAVLDALYVAKGDELA